MYRVKIAPRTGAGKALHKVAKNAAQPLVLEVLFAVSWDLLKASSVVGVVLILVYSTMVYLFREG